MSQRLCDVFPRAILIFVLMSTVIYADIPIDRDDRILGGRYAEHGEWPSIVAISFNPGKSSCGANIVTPLILLTACHCITQLVVPQNYRESFCLKPGGYSGDFRLVAGSISRNPYTFQGFQVRYVYYWEPHPKCTRAEDSGEWVFDIAIIHLSEELVYNAFVQPIPLPRNQTTFKSMIDKWQDERKACQVAGWGFTAARIVGGGAEVALNASEVLKVLDMRLQTTDECLDYLCQWESTISRYDCKQRYRFHGVDRICAVPRYSQNGSICGGDSGGPLRCDDYVIGVVSYGTRCSDLDAPIVFARVDAALPFILKAVGPSPTSVSTSSILDATLWMITVTHHVSHSGYFPSVWLNQ